jgi:hypothetical protein
MSYGWVMLTTEQEKAEKAFKVNAEKAFKKIVAEFKEKYVQEPHPEFGYCSDYSYKWFRDSLYLNQTYRYDSPESPIKEKVHKIARLDYYFEDGSCGLMYMRHTGKWEPLCGGEGVTLKACVDILRNDEIFHG